MYTCFIAKPKNCWTNHYENYSVYLFFKIFFAIPFIVNCYKGTTVCQHLHNLINTHKNNIDFWVCNIFTLFALFLIATIWCIGLNMKMDFHCYFKTIFSGIQQLYSSTGKLKKKVDENSGNSFYIVIVIYFLFKGSV